MVWLEEKERTLQSEGSASLLHLISLHNPRPSSSCAGAPVPPPATARITRSYLEKNAVSSEKAAEFQLAKQNTSTGPSDCPVTFFPNFETLSSEPSMTGCDLNNSLPNLGPTHTARPRSRADGHGARPWRLTDRAPRKGRAPARAGDEQVTTDESHARSPRENSPRQEPRPEERSPRPIPMNEHSKRS